MENKTETSRMKTWEWALWLFLSLVVDVTQIVLNLAFGSGVLINRLITLGFGGAMGAYFHWRGISLVNPRVLLRFGGTMVAEFIPVMDFLPMWVVGTVLTWITTKSKVVSKTVGVASKVSGATGKTSGPMNSGGVRMPESRNTNLSPMVVDGMRQPRK